MVGTFSFIEGGVQSVGMRSTWVGKTSGKQKRRVVYGIKDEQRCKFWRKDKANKTKTNITWSEKRGKKT